MKTVVIVGLALALFLVWNGRQSTFDTAPSDERVSPDVTQVIIEKIQAMHPDMVPLETLFINHQGEDLYTSRFMFLDTRHFYGTQYDVKARVNKSGAVDIMDMTETATVDYSRGYKPDKYQDWNGIQGELDKQLKDALKSPVTGPPLEAYRR